MLLTLTPELWGFTQAEWNTLTSTEKKIVLLVRQHKIEDHKLIALYLNWPLAEPIPESTYKSAWSRLRKKVANITRLRSVQYPVGLPHEESPEVREGTGGA